MAHLSPKLVPLLRSAIAHHQAGRLAEAAAGYARVLAAAPGDFQALHLAGAVALQRGEAAAAIGLLQRAARAQPRSAPTLMCLGLAYSAAGDRAAAETHLRQSLKLEPRNAEAWGNLGALHVLTGRISEAIDAFGRAVKLAPGSAQAWSGLGAAHLLAGRAGEALHHHERAVSLDPRHLGARFARGQALLACQRVEEAMADFAAVLDQEPDHAQARSYWLFTRNYLGDVRAEELFADHVEFGRRIPAAAPTVAGPRDPAPDRRLRLAFLSPDLRAHSIAWFLEPLLAHLDRDAFEIVLYHDHYKVDAVSERLRSQAALWRNFVGLPDSGVEAQIRADAPDVLVDLSGHGSLNRLPLFARRLAPVQVAYLGYPNTTGLPAMDYRLTDAIADPIEVADRLHTEKLLRFAPTAWAYAPPAEAPAVALPPTLAGAPAVFGSFNNVAKLNHATLQLWARVLEAVPRSRLMLKSFGLEPVQFAPRLERAGIDPARVDLLAACPRVEDHLACYGRIDVALDPFPYAGTTTTCEALWMGRPVITLAGDRHASRVGASLLHAIGCAEWIADDPAHYVRLAATLAQDPEGLRQRAGELRSRLQASPLLDHTGQARRFGAALRGAWQNWVASRAAASRAA